MKIFLWSSGVVFLGFLVPFFCFQMMLSFLGTQKLPAEFYSANVGNLDYQVPVQYIEIAPEITSEAKNTSLVFVGDIMMGRAVEQSVLKNRAGGFAYLFEESPFLAEADIAFANLEGCIAVVGNDIGNLYSFRFQPDALEALKNAGFDAMSVANNHAADWGKDAFEENIFRLKNSNILPIGGGFNSEEATRVGIIEKNGIKIGFLGFSDVGPGWFEAGDSKTGILLVKDDFSSLIEVAAQKVDVLVVSLHFGEEYQAVPNGRQKELAHLAIDSGAKIVAGHHPHVIQEVERYNGGVIAYSLGNFIFDQNFSEETMEGLVLEISLAGKELSVVKTFKVKLNRFYQPIPEY